MLYAVNTVPFLADILGNRRMSDFAGRYSSVLAFTMKFT